MNPVAPALLLLLLVGCATSLEVLPAPRPVDAVEGAQLGAVLDALVEERGLPGATCAVLFADGRLFTHGSGSPDPARGGASMPAEGRMLAGSTGKSLFAAAALLLQEDGAVDLDDGLARWLGEEPWFGDVPNGAALTLRQLLHHTSGVPEHVWDPAVIEELTADPDRRWRPEELARLVAGRAALGPPGEAFSYADANYVLAMLAVQRAAGRDLHAVIQERLLGPLGLANTYPSLPRTLPGLVQGHVVLGAQLGSPPRFVLEDGRSALATSFEWAGGGYVSTSRDLAVLARALWSGALFGDEGSLGELLEAVPTPDGPGDAYGIGTILRDTELGPARGHDGFFPGYLTSVAWFPDRGVAVAVQVNTDDVRRLGGPLFQRAVLPLARAAAGA